MQRGDSVCLRYPTPEDREEFIELRRSSRRYLERWEPTPASGFDAFGADYFERELATCRTPKREGLLVCRRGDGAIVGRLSLQEIIRGPLQQCFLGYWMGEAFAGNGFMTEAIGLSLRHAFGRLRLHRVEANVQPHNEASRAVVRSNGFRLEGFSPRYLKVRSRWADHERWAVHAEEWRQQSRRSYA